LELFVLARDTPKTGGTGFAMGFSFCGWRYAFCHKCETILESHKKGFEREATFGLIAGFVIMMVLDCLFI
jgi:ZIP family zinc transporter